MADATRTNLGKINGERSREVVTPPRLLTNSCRHSSDERNESQPVYCE
jgi:hypothetical protein